MRILQVIEFFTPAMGGSAQVAYQIARHLTRAGHQVTVCTSDYGLQEENFPAQGFKVKYFASLPTRWNFYITPGLIPWAWKHLDEFDIIHMHNVRTFQNAVIGAIARRKGIPYVLSAHGSLPYLVEHGEFKRLYDHLFRNSLVDGAQRFLAVSSVEVGQFLSGGIPEGKIVLMPNGLDLEEFQDLPARGGFRKRAGIPDNIPLLLFLGRLHRRKGIHYLVEAFARIQLHSFPEAALAIVGPDDGELAFLQQMVDQKGLKQKVFFPGPVYGQDLLAAYVDADIMVSPATQEIFGLVPFESILCGTPVVVTDDSGSGQLIAAANAGYLVPYANVEQLAEALQQVFTSPDDARLLVKSGQQYIRDNLDWNKIIRRIEKIYEACVTTALYSQENN